MRKIRPIRIFWQDGVSERQVDIVTKAIKMLLFLAGAENKIEIKLGGKVCDPARHRDDNILSDFFGCYNAVGIIDDFTFEQRLDNYNTEYIIFLMQDKIFMNTDEGIKSIGGVARSGESAVVSVGYDFLPDLERIKIFNTYCLTIHELGHIFYLPSEERKEEIELSPINKTRHCANDCILYPVIRQPMNKDIFCPTCLNELRGYFEEK